MKLLFDENLSPKLPNRLSDLFPESLHVRDVGMKATVDPIVWDYAKDNDLMIVSKDARYKLSIGKPTKSYLVKAGKLFDVTSREFTASGFQCYSVILRR
jgi:predicted nuclease of predicted toxin-antitoxin system